jgi:hypothetical protein
MGGKVSSESLHWTISGEVSDTWDILDLLILEALQEDEDE